MGVSPTDVAHLRRCVELAAAALAGGNDPFGSILVSGNGMVLVADHNRKKGGVLSGLGPGDQTTRHRLVRRALDVPS